MVLDSVPGGAFLDTLGFNVNELGTRPLVFYGGEGFAQMVGPWRLGGYAGIGATQASNVYDIHLYANKNNKIGYQEENPETDKLYDHSDKLSIKARLNFLLGALTIEYVFPVYRDLEVMGGALMGVGRYSFSIDQHIGTPKWNELGRNMYGYIKGDSVMVELDTWDGKLDDDDTIVQEYRTNGLRPISVNGTMTELSGTFFNFQPYVAVKWQLLDRVGLRISAGFNKGTIGQGRWKLNSRYLIGDSEEYTLSGVTFRTMLYLGL